MLGITNMTSNHCKIFERNGIKFFVTFHPAAALRFRATEVLMQKDIIALRKTLKQDRNISNKSY